MPKTKKEQTPAPEPVNELQSILSQEIAVPTLSQYIGIPTKIVAVAGGVIVLNDSAAAAIITTVDQQEVALTALKEVRAEIKKIEADFKTVKDPLNERKSKVLELEHKTLAPFKAIEQAISKANSEFRLTQERIAREERERLERAEREKQLAAARQESERLENEGKIGAAVSVMAEAESTPAPIIAPVVVQNARVAGITSRANYSAEVTDFKALVEYCLANPGLMQVFLSPNMTALNQQARSLKEQFNVPGVKANKSYV